MPKSRTKLAEIAQKHWCATGEQIVWAVNAGGHVGSAAGVPHRPAGQVPAAAVPEPDWPLPTEAVSTGRFRRDEWVHDPAVWGWATGPATAAAWADLFAVGRDECWLLLSNRRLALVVEGTLTAPAPTGGLLGRVRTLGQDRDAPPLVTWWESPVTARFRAVPLGRRVEPEWFVRVEFTDGSTFDFRDANAEQSVVTAYANL
ncbi:hypothetical protein [Umezawaea sp.]|uniref:hypothetical protein n=1 Tax=Umezawaea sp. TaxID=1955258 RepID=UPI002ED17F2D